MKDFFQLLFKKYNKHTIPTQQRAIVDEWYQREVEKVGEAPNEIEVQEEVWHNLVYRIQSKPKVIRLKSWKWVAAAMLCISLGIIAYWTMADKTEPLNIAAIKPATRHAFIATDGSKEMEITDLKTPSPTSNSNKVENIEITAPKGASFDLVLPDGTKVFLNSDSKISYPSKFVGTSREVRLEGEAYFEVSHNREKPFIVTTKEGGIKVLGTKFNVKAYADMKDNLVSLLEGSVQLSNQFSNTLLKPGEMAVMRKDAKTIRTQNIGDADPIAWKSGYFNFNNMPISELCLELGRWYNVQFDLSKLSKDIILTGRIRRDKNLKVILELLSTTDEIYFETKDQFIVIKND